MKRILVTDGMDKSAVQELKDSGFEVVEQFFEPDQLGEYLKTFNAIVVRSATKVRVPIIDTALETGNLSLIVRGGVGVDNIDVYYAMEQGIKVANTPNASSASVAELAIGHMFSLARNIGIANVTMRNGEWNKKQYQGIELGGKTLGLVGFGRIARETAKRARALGMNVIYTNQSGEKTEYSDIYKYCSFEEVLAESDFLSIHVPALKGGRILIGPTEFSQMKQGSFLINCARGGVVDENALLDALNSGRLAGAGVDVFAEEPTKNERLYTHPKVSVTPHIGGSTSEAQARIGEEIVSIIKDHFK